MNATELYVDYLALKQHFTKPNYDYKKYNGKLRVRTDSFQKRKDKLFFEKLAKHPDPHNFLVANLAANEKAWIGDLAYSEKAQEVYSSWLKRQQSLTYVFKQDLKKLDPSFNKNLISDGHHPLLLQLYLGNEINLETLCILVDMTKVMKHWDSKMPYDPIWETVKMRIVKYTPFIKYDREKIKSIIFSEFTE